VLPLLVLEVAAPEASVDCASAGCATSAIVARIRIRMVFSENLVVIW
jgi:hypothetical protein